MAGWGQAHVGQEIFHGCVKGALQGKTCVLVTHQIHLLSECDEIIVLENGTIKACGSYTKLTRSGIDISAFIPQSSTPISSPATSKGKSAARVAPLSPIAPVSAHPSEKGLIRNTTQRSGEDDSSKFPTFERVNSVFSEHSDLPIPDATLMGEESFSEEPAAGTETAKVPVPAGDTLMTIEERARGDVDWGVYWYYIRAGGTCACMGVVISLLLVQVFALGSNFYLTYWGDKSNRREDNGNPMSSKSNMEYMTVFASLSLGGVVCLVMRGLFLAEAQMASSLHMHTRLLNRILGAPVGFFDVTPLGRIVNRFSSDMTTVDENLSQSISQMTYSLFSCFGALVAIGIATKGAFMALAVRVLFPLPPACRASSSCALTVAHLQDVL